MLLKGINLFTRAIGTLALLFVNSATEAATIFVGSNTADSVQLYTTAGTHVGPFGPTATTGTALDGQGHVYVAQPDAMSSVITKYDAAENLLDTIVFSGGIDNGVGFEGFITDMAYGGGGTLWVSGYNGIVYHIDAAGAVLHHFDTGSPFSGIASDGTYLYTSQGLGGGDLYQRMMDGTLVMTIATGLPESFGLGVDRSDGSMWVGGSDVVTHVSAAGMVINTLSISGIHDGIEVGDIGTAAIPEPATFLISGLGLAGLMLFKRKGVKKNLLSIMALAALGTAWTTRLDAAITVNLAASPVQPRPVGTKVTWTTSATDTAAGALHFRFSVRNPGDVFRIVKDFSSSTTLDWTPGEREGGYEIRVTARNKTTLQTADRTETYMITSRITGGVPVVSATDHPLVALYSAPACPAGSQMRVRFQRAVGDTYWQSTPMKSCIPGASMNFYIAGMLASTQYSIKHDLFNGPIATTGPTRSFTTGALPFVFPVLSVVNPPDPPSSTQQPILLHSYYGQGADIRLHTATNLSGQVVWYLPQASQVGGGGGIRYRPIPGGTFILERAVTGMGSNLQEYDLVGNLVRETNVARVNEQLAAMGKNQPISSFHHDAFRLPNGNTVAITGVERLFTNVQGPGTVDVLGDALVVLDANFQVVWFWNPFEHPGMLPPSRKAILDEQCTSPAGSGGCPPYFLSTTTANDWMHSNSVSYTTDGHFIMSVRHQDWVIKIDYANGTGTGNLIWRLGKDGDFTINSTDPFPWFSHSHDAQYELGGNQLLSIYDNGNTRRAQNPTANSRGQAYRINEVTRQATLELNADLGVYAGSVGAAQRLLNGNYHFTSGNKGGGTSRSHEVNPSGVLIYELDTTNSTDYRSFRMRDMYTP